MHLGECRLELRHDLGQGIARLGVRGDQRELALVAVGKLVGQALDIARVEQHALDNFGQLLAGIGESGQALATADEYLHTQLILKILDVFGDAGLRSE